MVFLALVSMEDLGCCPLSEITVFTHWFNHINNEYRNFLCSPVKWGVLSVCDYSLSKVHHWSRRREARSSRRPFHEERDSPRHHGVSLTTERSALPFFRNPSRSRDREVSLAQRNRRTSSSDSFSGCFRAHPRARTPDQQSLSSRSVLTLTTCRIRSCWHAAESRESYSTARRKHFHFFAVSPRVLGCTCTHGGAVRWFPCDTCHRARAKKKTRGRGGKRRKRDEGSAKDEGLLIEGRTDERVTEGEEETDRRKQRPPPAP